MKRIFALVLALSVLFTTKVSGEYVLINLSNDSTNESCAYDVNDFGFSVGYQKNGEKIIPMFWTPQSGNMELPNLTANQNGSAFSINEGFQITGMYGNTFYNVEEPFLLKKTPVIWAWDESISSFSPYKIDGESIILRGINDAGDVVGSKDECAYIYNIYNGNNIKGNPSSHLCAINNNGNVVGAYLDYWYGYNPFFLEKDLDGNYNEKKQDFYSNHSSVKINNNDQIVGNRYTGGFYWEPKNNKTIFFPENTKCFNLNNVGQIVGSTNDLACMWTRSSDNQFTCTNLNDLNTSINITCTNVVLEKAFAINDKGQIVGQMLDKTLNVRKAFMLVPAQTIPCKFTKNSEGKLILSWQTKTDHTYTFKISCDLKIWVTPNIYLVGDGTETYIEIPSDEKIMFIQVLDLNP